MRASIASTLGVCAVVSLLTGACSCDVDGLDFAGGPDDSCRRSENDLVRAAEDGDAARVRQAIRNGVDPDTADDAGNTALACAGPKGHVEIVDLLLDAGADPRTKARDGDSLVADAVLFCQNDVLDRLLEAGAPASERTGDDVAVLEVALQSNNDRAVGALLEHGASPDGFDANADREWFEVDGRENWPPAHCPDDPAGLEAALLVLLEAGAPHDKVLERALRENHTEPVRGALAAGADPNADSGSSSTSSPLVLAAAWGNAESMALLLDAGADPHHGVLEAGPESAVALCSLRGASPEPSTALRCESVSYLLVIERGAGTPFRGQRWSVPPIVEAAGSGDLASVELLLARGADPNAVAEFGFTPLHAAAASGDVEVIDRLVTAGARRPDSAALLPSEIARRSHRVEAADLLTYLAS